MRCFGCYKENINGYCFSCKKKLFEGKKVNHLLSINPHGADHFKEFQEKTKRLSISGVQLKYSATLQNKELILTDSDGHFILKPIPPTTTLTLRDQAPENEHLTMQIASQLFKIPVAENALIYFEGGTPAYITRRFDRKPDGSKYLQEDFAQISGKSKSTNGENYKYDGNYEEVAKLIKKYVAAYQPAIEILFKQILFNYIFSNGDAHLKNFSLMLTDHGDYALTPAYDLMSTRLHTPNESDMALDLYADDHKNPFYSTYGFYGLPDFEEFAKRIGIIPKRSKLIIDSFLLKSEAVYKMIDNSFLNDEAKDKYTHAYNEKIRRFSAHYHELL